MHPTSVVVQRLRQSISPFAPWGRTDQLSGPTGPYQVGRARDSNELHECCLALREQEHKHTHILTGSESLPKYSPTTFNNNASVQALRL